MALPVKSGAGRWRKKKGCKTINTTGYIIKFQRVGSEQGLLWFFGYWFFSFSLRHRKRSGIGFDTSKIVAEEMENYYSDFFKQVAACLYNPSKQRPKQL